MRRSVILLAALATAALLASGVALAETPSANNPVSTPLQTPMPKEVAGKQPWQISTRR